MATPLLLFSDMATLVPFCQAPAATLLGKWGLKTVLGWVFSFLAAFNSQTFSLTLPCPPNSDSWLIYKMATISFWQTWLSYWLPIPYPFQWVRSLFELFLTYVSCSRSKDEQRGIPILGLPGHWQNKIMSNIEYNAHNSVKARCDAITGKFVPWMSSVGWVVG